MARDEAPEDECKDQSIKSPDDGKPTGEDKLVRRRSLLRRRWKLFSVIFALLLVLIILVVSLVASLAKRKTSDNKTVDLGYAQYQGSRQPKSDVKAWLGIRYAAPPVGALRFEAPQDPVKVKGIQDAKKHGKTCLAVGDRPPVRNDTSEDCLFLDVFAPSKAHQGSKLPVFFFIQGGGFAIDANANYNGRGLIEAAALDMIVVTFNYRVGPYGFIAGNEIKSPNNGLKDQRKALAWVKQHISKFGGDPDQIVLGGDSAGGASVVIHMAAYGGNGTGLFHGAAIESPSFATVLTNNQSQFLFDDFVNNTSCASSPDALSCLRGLSSDEIQQANQRYPYPNATGLPVFSWNPVIDGDMIRDLLYSSFSQGNFVKVPTIVGDDSNGGTIFVTRNISTLDQSNQFLQNTFPYLNQTHLDKLNELYPNNPNDTLPGSGGSYWQRTASVYGDIRYMCPNIFVATAVNTHGKNQSISAWNYRYNVQDPKQVANGLGVPHTVELSAIWGPDNIDGDPAPNSYRPGQPNAAIVPLIQGYWTSFIRSLNPNTFRQQNSSEWETWQTEIEPNTQKASARDDPRERLLFNTPVNATQMETLDAGLWEKCEYLWSIALDIHQ